MDGDGAGITGKRSGTATWGHSGQRERHLGCHFRNCRRGKSGRLPLGGARGKGKDFRTVGKPGQQVLRSGGQVGGPRGLQSGGKPRGGPPVSGRGIPIAEGHQHPCSGRIDLGGRNLQSDHRGSRSSEGEVWGRGKYGNSPTIRETEARRASVRD